MYVKKKHPGGRPTVMIDSVIGKLEEGFMMGLTDTEACLYADIVPSTLYEYIKKHPEFSEKKEMLKDSIKMRAKYNVKKAVEEGDKDMTKWYLERKAKDEFSTKQEIKEESDTTLTIKRDTEGTS